MSTPHTTPIAVLGATGQQGIAVVDALLAAGRSVRAVVRNPGSAKAAALAARGVEVVAGDQDDPDSLRGPLADVEALFLMTTFADDSGTEGEVRRGVATADVTASAGVPRVVYSSVGGAERASGVPHFESKYRVEQHLTSVLPTVVVRPTFFMDNLAGQVDAAGDGEFVLRQPMPGDVPLQMIAVRDIGVVAAAALVDPQALGGDSLEIAGDALTGSRSPRASEPVSAGRRGSSRSLSTCCPTMTSRRCSVGSSRPTPTRPTSPAPGRSTPTSWISPAGSPAVRDRPGRRGAPAGRREQPAGLTTIR